MKKFKLFSLFGLGFLFTFGLLLGATRNSTPIMLHAEGEEITEPAPAEDPVEEPTEESTEEPEEEPEEEFECKVVLSASKHGELKADKLEGHVGDTVTLTANADIFYLAKSVSVNGTALVEDEETTGKFTFLLVEGENKVVATFAVDEKLLGELSGLVDQAANGDWANLFTLKNLIAIISFVLNGGLLLVIIRYFVKDKRLAKRVEEGAKKALEKLLPEALRETVTKFLTDLLTPYLAKIEANGQDIQDALVVFSRCMALAQENTPESRIAITKELSSLKNSDKASINMIEEKINNFIKEQNNITSEMLSKLKNIKIENKEIVEKTERFEEVEQQVEQVAIEDGSQI